jgi:non-ribosomal peptide synthetase component F
VAVVFEDEAITYAELNGRANQLAHHLQDLGIGPEKQVGISMERSIEMVFSLLAVLKAGGAYVPLDPSYPAERLAFLLADSQISVILSLWAHPAIPDLGARSLSWVCLGRDHADWWQASREQVPSALYPTNLVSVIYTS